MLKYEPNYEPEKQLSSSDKMKIIKTYLKLTGKEKLFNIIDKPVPYVLHIDENNISECKTQFEQNGFGLIFKIAFNTTCCVRIFSFYLVKTEELNQFNAYKTYIGANNTNLVIVETVTEEKEQVEKVMQLINDYCNKKSNVSADFSDFNKIMLPCIDFNKEENKQDFYVTEFYVDLKKKRIVAEYKSEYGKDAIGFEYGSLLEWELTKLNSSLLVLEFRNEIEKSIMFKKAKQLINDYCLNTLGSKADFSNLDFIPMGSKNFEENERKEGVYKVQIYCDLTEKEIIIEFKHEHGKNTKIKKYNSLEELIEYELNTLNFDSLISE